MKIIISVIAIIIYGIIAFYFNNRKIDKYIKDLDKEKYNERKWNK